MSQVRVASKIPTLEVISICIYIYKITMNVHNLKFENEISTIILSNETGEVKFWIENDAQNTGVLENIFKVSLIYVLK